MLRRPQTAARRRACAIVACVLCVWLSIGSASAAPTGVTIEDSTIQGDGVIATENDLTYLADWEPANITVDIAANNGVYRVCVEAGNGTDRRSLTCERVENSGQTATATLPVNTSSIDASGQQTLSVVVHEPTSSDDEPLATEPQQVTVLPAGGDFDNDGLNNKRERERGTDLRTADSDGDGLTDSQEVNIYHTNPLQRDTDDDGLGDGIEVNEHGTNPTVQDTDHDNLTDAAEVNVHGTDPTTADTDGDGLSDSKEIQTTDTDPTTKDTDGDGLSDGREIRIFNTNPTREDTDGDGLTDGVEVNTYETNPTDPDTDGDGLSDGSEVNKYDTDPNSPDTDGDGINDATEVKRGTNPTGGISSVFAAFRRHPLLMGGIGSAVGLVLVGVLHRIRMDRADADDADLSESSSRETSSETTPTVGAPSDPLTDAERVRHLLIDNGGRIQQSEIVRQTEWSKSKVSRLLSKMEQENQITKINIGRENLITRPGSEPKMADTTIED